MDADSREDVLTVRTFGGFAMEWRGRPVAGSIKTRESQFIYLMQLLLHERDRGVSRDLLEEVLFGDRDVGDTRHALRSVIYNAKRRLRESGLPDLNYILHRKGIYYWTDRVPVTEDAWEFEKLCGEAGREEDPDRKLELYYRAGIVYGGEFLAAHAGVLWVAREAKRYRNMFFSCVEKAVEMLRDKRDFQRMKELGIHASKASPLSDWETVTMEALVAMERYEEARKLYDDTVEYYYREQGLRPSRQLMLLVRRLGVQMEHGYGALEDIQENLSGKKGQGAGGYLCSYPVFQGIYRIVERMMGRDGQSAYLMLCAPESGLRDEQAASARLADAILDSVRKSDAVSKYGREQYLVLLVNTTIEGCNIVKSRISGRFRELYRGADVRYCVNPVEGCL